MTSKSPFKSRHFLPQIILWGVRCYCSYPISYRNLEEMMCERGVEVDHSTLRALGAKVCAMPLNAELWQNKYLNNRIEQDHRFIKRLTKPGMGFHWFNTADADIKRI